MTHDEIIKLAHEADCLDDQHYGTVWANKLERFAALAAAAEREACARLLDDQWFKTQSDCAAAIRARGEK